MKENKQILSICCLIQNPIRIDTRRSGYFKRLAIDLTIANSLFWLEYSLIPQWNVSTKQNYKVKQTEDTAFFPTLQFHFVKIHKLFILCDSQKKGETKVFFCIFHAN